MAQHKTPFRILSVNVEKRKHIQKVTEFIREISPDVVCLQEARQCDLDTYADAACDPRSLERLSEMFVPCAQDIAGDAHSIWGLAILSRYPIVSHYVHYYVKHGERGNPIYDPEDPQGSPDRALLVADIGIGNSTDTLISVGTTHFTWSEGGKIDDAQLHDFGSLLKCLQIHPELVLCGDLNTPRGDALWGYLASQYRDHIPPEITTTIDPEHKAGPLQLVVDGLFSTREYVAREVGVISGISDHMAIVADMQRV